MRRTSDFALPLSAAPPQRAETPRSKPSMSAYFDKEKLRASERTVYTHELWRRHRSTDRYSRHMAGMLISRILWGLSGPLTSLAVLAMCVCTYETMLHWDLLPPLLPGMAWPSIVVTAEGPFSISTFALSLLLVFRTNSSYARFNEARTLWGTVVNRSRDLVRQALTYIPDGPASNAVSNKPAAGSSDDACEGDSTSERQRVAEFARWAAAFPMAMMFSLRDDVDLRMWLQGVMLPHEVDQVVGQAHAPLAVMGKLGHLLRVGGVDPMGRATLDESITTLCSALGGCERIFKTPIPLSYTRHTSRVLVLWLTVLPFCIWDHLWWFSTVVAMLMAFVLLGVDECATYLEEPFSILPLEAICEGIAKNVEQLTSQAGVQQPIPWRPCPPIKPQLPPGYPEFPSECPSPACSPGGRGLSPASSTRSRASLLARASSSKRWWGGGQQADSCPAGTSDSVTSVTSKDAGEKAGQKEAAAEGAAPPAWWKSGSCLSAPLVGSFAGGSRAASQPGGDGRQSDDTSGDGPVAAAGDAAAAPPATDEETAAQAAAAAAAAADAVGGDAATGRQGSGRLRHTESSLSRFSRFSSGALDRLCHEAVDEEQPPTPPAAAISSGSRSVGAPRRSSGLARNSSSEQSRRSRSGSSDETPPGEGAGT